MLLQFFTCDIANLTVPAHFHLNTLFMNNIWFQTEYILYCIQSFAYSIQSGKRTSTSSLIQCHRYPKYQGVSTIIPDQQFLSYINVFSSSVVNTAMILKYNHVLFKTLTGTSYKTHPTRVRFISRIEVMTYLTVVEDLWIELSFSANST